MAVSGGGRRGLAGGGRVSRRRRRRQVGGGRGAMGGVAFRFFSLFWCFCFGIW